MRRLLPGHARLGRRVGDRSGREVLRLVIQLLDNGAHECEGVWDDARDEGSRGGVKSERGTVRRLAVGQTAEDGADGYEDGRAIATADIYSAPLLCKEAVGDGLLANVCW